MVNFFPSVGCVYLVMFVTHDCHNYYIPCIIFLGDAVVVDPHTIYTANGNLVEPGMYNLFVNLGKSIICMKCLPI